MSNVSKTEKEFISIIIPDMHHVPQSYLGLLVYWVVVAATVVMGVGRDMAVAGPVQVFRTLTYFPMVAVLALAYPFSKHSPTAG
ncbi:hypothetical protein AGABI1DRAFT_84052 [Agaricus bisporus var. burnettii JB137-S8]|uniref:Uncharacterized protein n=1 Tax=Agaricus bisporus var. burnettii (strain JB137-S8 / ATCC MYA-4627 / FGSC 10392) TaxID=597362 RepID=K5XDA4_AGABU|nr:uncharacterized protein AGABI1DRAFT_84052 [Agaricus bisporus var. burnettii JB137-S8]EKM81122.1 hypothetical protein AGABI1DRAFT_84052 [Agaricus bisporus var. burnettii JB137-S8]